MSLTSLNAISPVDGRYRRVTAPLADYFFEAALIRYRVRVEIEYFIALSRFGLSQLGGLDKVQTAALRGIYTAFTTEDAERVKAIEAETNHDVKAVEYFLKEAFDGMNLSGRKEFLHFGLTSQDINNTAVPLSLKDAWEAVVRPAIESVVRRLTGLALEWEDVPMLARTHGQPASPSRLGKELYVFVTRLQDQLELMKVLPHRAKFGGASGNFNAHYAACPDKNWPAFADGFIQRLGLERTPVTTQIEPYDFLGAFCDGLKRINTIFMDLSRDVWTYISMDYFKQKIRAGEVGSSTMPHKVNPIDFENAEGNLGVANALLGHLAEKLPVSRLQRDLSDSTVLRNLGMPLAHSLIATASLNRGLDKLLLNQGAIAADLDQNWAVVTEGLQTILRREGYPDPYEALKKLSRTGTAIGMREVCEFIDSLTVSDAVKNELRQLTPQTYLGVKPEIDTDRKGTA